MEQSAEREDVGARTETAATPRRARQSFTEFLLEVGDGVLASDLTDRKEEIVAAMVQHAQASGGKPKGQLKLIIDFKMDAGVFQIVGDVAVKLPKAVRPTTFMWASRDGRISRQNPAQLDAFADKKDVGVARTTEVRTLPLRGER